MPQSIRLVVNGQRREVSTEPARSLLAVIRDDLALPGTKLSCLEGICGACTVLLDDEPVRSCVTRAGDADGRSITTIEGLAEGGRLGPVQQGFADELGFQCGFCTPGQIMNAAGLLRRNPAPSDDEIREAMDGNVCRCGAYPRILRSVRRAAELAASPGVTWQDALPEPATGRDGTGVAAARRPARPWDRQDPGRREHFDLLGDGLVAVLPPDEARRNPGHGQGPWLANGGAWLHVGAGGAVTAFTGKADVGQDNRTALSMLVADELGAPLQAVRLVMADTDLCPFDVGTFGSRSMPDAGTYLRAAAACARDVLLRAAADRWGIEAARLEARDGRAVRGDGDTIAFGDLVRGVRRIELAAIDQAGQGTARRARVAEDTGQAATSAVDRVAGEAVPTGADRVAGVPTRKLIAPEIVTGRHAYVLDLTRPGMLVGLVVRPPSLGATLRSVDLGPARAMPGVTAIVEEDFVGVAAPDLAAGRAARAAVRAEWDEHPQPSEEGIAGYLRAHPIELHGWGGQMDNDRGNTEAISGDVDAALGAAAARVEQTYTTAYLAHVPLETRDALAEWDGGRLTVWTGTQRPFGVRAELAEALGVSEDDVRVIVPDTGGGFGGKHTGEAALEAARLARAAGRPVKVRWSREEEMTWAYFRPYAVIDVRAAAGPDGTLTAWDFTNTNSGPNALLTPYAVPNRRQRYQPADSPLRIGSYRALAATANTFARESAMDELAVACGTDPLEFRLRNLPDERLAAVFRAAADRAGWDARPNAPGNPRLDGYGMGIAGCSEKGGRIATVAEVRVGEDGTLGLLRLVSAFEAGAIVNPGNLANQVEGAAVMGIGGALYEAVHFANGHILTPTLKEYRVPRMWDIPRIEVVLVDRPDLPSAGGGETPIVAVAPAIANAIHAACGTRLRGMPLAPDGRVPLPGR